VTPDQLLVTFFFIGNGCFDPSHLHPITHPHPHILTPTHLHISPRHNALSHFSVSLPPLSSSERHAARDVVMVCGVVMDLRLYLNKELKQSLCGSLTMVIVEKN
jgi:hypothetical protein